MKQIDKMSRLTGELEKAFRLINSDFFDNTLPMPIITVTPTSKAYAHYTPWSAWQCKGEGKREINISSAYLDRPLENVIASLIHEAVHMYNDCVLNVQDVSRGGTYHNKYFKREAETRGLNISRDPVYGWTITEPNDDLILWLCDHEELREIELCRSKPLTGGTNIGGRSNNSGGMSVTIGTNPNSHSRKYQCPCCGNSVRATKAVRIMCLDCGEVMEES